MKRKIDVIANSGTIGGSGNAPASVNDAEYDSDGSSIDVQRNLASGEDPNSSMLTTIDPSAAANNTFVPTTSRNPVWSGFQWSLERDKHGRRLAKCRFCESLFSGRPMRLKRHFLVATERCKLANEEFIENYTFLINARNRSFDGDNDDEIDADKPITALLPTPLTESAIKAKNELMPNNLTMISANSHNPVWSGFNWSVEKDKHGRRTAQCKFCSLILGGRPMRLKRHFMVNSERCPVATIEFIEQYANAVKNFEKERYGAYSDDSDGEIREESLDYRKKRRKSRGSTGAAGTYERLSNTLGFEGTLDLLTAGATGSNAGTGGAGRLGGGTSGTSNHHRALAPVATRDTRKLNVSLLKSLLAAGLPINSIESNPFFLSFFSSLLSSGQHTALLGTPTSSHGNLNPLYFPLYHAKKLFGLCFPEIVQETAIDRNEWIANIPCYTLVLTRLNDNTNQVNNGESIVYCAGAACGKEFRLLGISDSMVAEDNVTTTSGQGNINVNEWLRGEILENRFTTMTSTNAGNSTANMVNFSGDSAAAVPDHALLSPSKTSQAVTYHQQRHQEKVLAILRDSAPDMDILARETAASCPVAISIPCLVDTLSNVLKQATNVLTSATSVTGMKGLFSKHLKVILPFVQCGDEGKMLWSMVVSSYLSQANATPVASYLLQRELDLSPLLVGDKYLSVYRIIEFIRDSEPILRFLYSSLHTNAATGAAAWVRVLTGAIGSEDIKNFILSMDGYFAANQELAVLLQPLASRIRKLVAPYPSTPVVASSDNIVQQLSVVTPLVNVLTETLLPGPEGGMIAMEAAVPMDLDNPISVVNGGTTSSGRGNKKTPKKDNSNANAIAMQNIAATAVDAPDEGNCCEIPVVQGEGYYCLSDIYETFYYLQHQYRTHYAPSSAGAKIVSQLLWQKFQEKYVSGDPIYRIACYLDPRYRQLLHLNSTDEKTQLFREVVQRALPWNSEWLAADVNNQVDAATRAAEELLSVLELYHNSAEMFAGLNNSDDNGTAAERWANLSAFSNNSSAVYWRLVHFARQVFSVPITQLVFQERYLEEIGMKPASVLSSYSASSQSEVVPSLSQQPLSQFYSDLMRSHFSYAGNSDNGEDDVEVLRVNMNDLLSVKSYLDIYDIYGPRANLSHLLHSLNQSNQLQKRQANLPRHNRYASSGHVRLTVENLEGSLLSSIPTNHASRGKWEDVFVIHH